MKDKKQKLITIITILLLVLLVVAACSSNSEGQSGDPELQVNQGLDESIASVAWSDSTATEIILNGSSASINGSGATVEGSTVTINSAGTYLLRGTLASGQILVEAGEKDRVELVLNGVSITSQTNAAIYGKTVDQLIINLPAGSKNVVKDVASYTYADASAQEPDAAIFCKSDLSFKGGGALTLQANFKNGIGAKDDLEISDGLYNITAVSHGLRGRDSVTILAGTFTIKAGNDGIQSNNDEKEDKGFILLEGGSYNIEAVNDGIQAEKSLTIKGGTYAIVSGSGSGNLNLSSEESYKGLKAGTDLSITGGSFTIDSADDAIHANGNVLISNGSLTLATGDDGIHADGDLSISGGEIAISKSYEGLEAATMTISGGTIDVVASDDGLNIAGGNSGQGEGKFGRDSFSSAGNYWLKVSGGTIKLNAQGDGLDVNGNAELTGGTVLVHGPVSGGNGAIDYDGVFTVNGGLLVAVGSSGMAQAPGNGTQPTLMVNFSGAKKEGTVLKLTDAGGAEIVSFTSEKSFQNLVISSPGLVDGATYTLYADGSKVTDITLSGTLTRVNDSGENLGGGGMNGGGGRGGGKLK